MKKRIVAVMLAMAMAVPTSSVTAMAARTAPDTVLGRADEQEVQLPKANVMDVDFTSGDAADQSPLQNGFRVQGSPTVTDSEELHKKIANFDGSSAYLYPFDASKYGKITDAVTIECMFKYNSLPSGEHDIFSNQQSGGIGLGVYNGRLTFFAHVAGSYRQPTASIQQGQWVHAVGVVDGTSVKLYVNGELASQIQAEGPVEFTSNAKAHNFVIGGDSSASGNAEYLSDAAVSFARLYDRALTEEEIRLLDEKAFEGADLPQLKPQQVNLGIVASDTASADGEMNVNLHLNGEDVGTIDKVSCELAYDSQALTYTGVQHKMSGVTIDGSQEGVLKLTYEGPISLSDFRQYASTRLGKLNFRTGDVTGTMDTSLRMENFRAYVSGEEVTDQIPVPQAEKTVTIYGKDRLDLNGDGVIGAGDVALAGDKEQQEAIAKEAAIYPYKHAVVLTVDGGGTVWDPDSMYYAASNSQIPKKTSDPKIMAKRTNTYAMELFNEEFATSYTAQAVVPSISGQNYTSMIHGVPWGDVEEEYQLTNDSSAQEYYADFGKETAKYPSMFQAIAKAAPERKQAAFAEWTNILNGIIEPDAPVIGKASESKKSFYDVADYIKSAQYQDTALVYMQSDWMDHVGHSSGYYNDNFWSELAQYDDYYKAVVDALKETGTYEETLIVSNADHGGSGYSHGSMDPSNMDIFIGPGGQTVDSGRRLEGGDNSDIASLVLAALRVEKPDSMTGEVFDENAFLSQEEMSKKQRDVEKVTFTVEGDTGALSLSNQKSRTRAIDAVIDLGGSTVKSVDAKGGTILRQEVEEGQLKLTISYDNQPTELAQLTFEGQASGDVKVREIMLGTAEGKEIYADLENVREETVFTDLSSWIQFLEDLSEEEYTQESWAVLEAAIEEAKTVEADPAATRGEIDQAVANLVKAFGALEYGVQRQHLQAAVDAASAILGAAQDYEEESLAALRAVIDGARDVLEDSKATQGQINQAASDVIDAIVLVIKDADIASLESLLKAVEGLDEAKYTQESYQALERAVESAKAVLANPDRTQEELALAYTGISQAIRGLELKGNKEALCAVIEKAEEILANASAYTQSSIRGLEAALAEAKAVYEDPDAASGEVQEAVTALTSQLVLARLKGDVDHDGRVSTADSAALLRYSAEMDDLDETQLDGADINGDGAADTKDAALVLQYAAEKVSAF